MSKTFVGSRLRQLRRERDISQAQLAATLGVSASYINQMEHDVRPLTPPVLNKITAAFGVDATFFAHDDAARLMAQLQEALADQELATDTIDMQEISHLAYEHPEFSRAVIELHRRYHSVRGSFALLSRSRREVEHNPASQAPQEASTAGAFAAATLPEEQVRDFFFHHHNYFDHLDRQAERNAQEWGLHLGDMEAAAAILSQRLNVQHSVSVHHLPPGAPLIDGSGHETLHTFNPQQRQLHLAAGLSAGQRTFRLATELALIEMAPDISRLLQNPTLTTAAATEGARRGLAHYVAAAQLMPYRRFHSLAEQSRYDIDQLVARTGLSYESVCHRLVTLQRHGLRGIPFTLVRVDRAGNVSKRQSATGQNIAHTTGTCPLWNVYEAFSQPGRTFSQLAQLPDGRSFLWVSRAIHIRPRSFSSPGKLYAIGLGCDTRHASRTVYGEGLQVDNPRARDLIGPGCRLCTHNNCPQRAFPPLPAALRGAQELGIDSQP